MLFCRRALRAAHAPRSEQQRFMSSKKGGKRRGGGLQARFPAAEVASERPPNIVFVVADDLGYGDLGCYGQAEIKTPVLDQMAAEGMRFTDFYAGCTVCAPSRSVLMTGKHMGRTYIRGNGGKPLPAEEVTVAEVLKDAGYATGGFGKWGLGLPGSVGVPTKQGFDEFFGFLSQHHAHNHYPSFLFDGEERVELSNVVPKEGKHGQGKASVKEEYATDLIFECARGFIRDHADEPFFCFLPLVFDDLALDALDRVDYHRDRARVELLEAGLGIEDDP